MVRDEVTQTHTFYTNDFRANQYEVSAKLFLYICCRNLVPRVFSLSNMAAAGEKTLAHSRNHVTDLSTESGNLFKMAAKIKSERIWVRGLETGEKHPNRALLIGSRAQGETEN